MALPEETPIVDTPIETTPTVPVPVIVGGVEEYGSSEEFARAHAVGIAKQKEEEKNREAFTEIQKVRNVLDKYIVKYSKTTETRKRAKAAKVSADHQLGVDADVVEILEKIKNELGRKK